MKKTGISNMLTATISMLSILMAMHYWFSYWYAYKILALFDITPTPIISIEDVTFSYGEQNLWIFVGASTFIFFVFVVHLLGDDVVKRLNPLIEKIKLPPPNKRNRIIAGIIGLVIIIVALICIYYSIRAVEIKHRAFASLSVLFLIGNICYFAFPKKRKIVSFVLIWFIFIWGTTLISTILADEKKYTLNNNTSMEISFTYNKNRITTSDTLGLVLHGYRYYVLYDATKKCSYLYPTNAIENIEYKYKCK